MNNQSQSLTTGFGNQNFIIVCNNHDAFRLAEFLFFDFPGAGVVQEPKHYDLIYSGSKPMISLWEGEKRLYFGQNPYHLAVILMNEVLYHCIDANQESHALHAGAVIRGDSCIILPGQSGTGKSTLTAWLVAHGYQYLTDELIFLADDGTVTPVTRPISLKSGLNHFSWMNLQDCDDQIIASENEMMIPHRLLNDKFTRQEPQVTHVVFPHYVEGATMKLQPLSSAKSCFMLMQSHVNARNLEGLGVPRLAETVRNCNSYSLTYSRFEDVESIFCSPNLLS
jgi:hypothetical protein